MQNFLAEWKSRGNEKSDSHQFWDAMFRTFWKILNPNELMKFEVPVQVGDSQCYIDFWIPGTRVIIEQKSRGRKLDKVERQSDGSMLNPFGQAKRYDDHRKTSEKARWIITCNFDEFWIYNLEADRPENHVRKIKLEELPERFGELDFLVDEHESEIKTAEYVSASAGSLIREIRDLFLNSKDAMSESEIKSLNKLCIQLVFCMYAEDSEIFPRKIFLNYLRDLTNKSLVEVKEDLSNLFWRLSLKELPRGIDSRLKKFPYVNISLFDGKSLEILDQLDGHFDLRQLILKLIDAAEKNIWSKISPTVFGSIFESVLQDDTRSGGGIHYTSIDNIHKVIDPLFLDNLNSEFKNCDDLEKFHDKIARLKFFDPACGSGNFLTETYISLRKLENRVIEKIGGSIKIKIENFYGIEINDFAVQVAKLALWISEHQMNHTQDFSKTNIIEGNSLSIDWKSVVSDADFIIGNPPYIGYSMQTPDQKSDMKKIFEGYRAAGKMDYVCAWFKKSAEYIRDSRVEVGFVSTNSICQGEHVGFLWKDLLEDGIKINFAWSTFKWSNESPDKKSMAHVYCVIVGFSRFDRKIKLLDGNPVKNINGYLQDAPNVCIESRRDSLMDVPKIVYGNKFADGTNLIIEAEDLDSFLEKDPRAKKFIHPLIGAESFLHKKDRYCLWLIDAEPSEIKSMKNVYARVDAVRKSRLSSKKKQTQDSAEFPTLPQEIRQPKDGNYIVIPRISGERRKYIPMGFLNFETIVLDSLQIIPNGSLELFGILMSKVHMAWVKTVAGYLGTSFNYSAQVVYNNFPFPKSNPKIEVTAQKILDARSNHPNSSLAELYDPNLMSTDLRKAHEENDRAVLDAYNFPKNISESEIVSRLFEMYQELIRK
ncbi:MAG: class I SAM-dependent DNA methyltransferase [Selenomonadaceae bacterium]|nr:class I SAM-dependent DNA methyltransferase [Selenomonadaceae bacterium]